MSSKGGPNNTSLTDVNARDVTIIQGSGARDVTIIQGNGSRTTWRGIILALTLIAIATFLGFLYRTTIEPSDPQSHNTQPRSDTEEISDAEGMSDTEGISDDTCRESAIGTAQAVRGVKIADAIWLDCTTKDSFFYRTGPDLIDYDHSDTYEAHKPIASICSYDSGLLKWSCANPHHLTSLEYNLVVGCDPTHDGYCSPSVRGSGFVPLLVKDFDDNGVLDFGYKAVSYLDLDLSEYRNHWGVWFIPSTVQENSVKPPSFISCTENGTDGYGNRLKNQCITSFNIDKKIHKTVIRELLTEDMLGPKDYIQERWKDLQSPRIATDGHTEPLEVDLSALLDRHYTPVSPGTSTVNIGGKWYIVLRSAELRDVKMLVELSDNPRGCFIEDEIEIYQIRAPTTYHVSDDIDCDKIRSADVVYVWISRDHNQWTSQVQNINHSIWLIENPNIVTQYSPGDRRLRRYRFSTGTEIQRIVHSTKIYACSTGTYIKDCLPISDAEELPVMPVPPVAYVSASRRIWLDDGLIMWITKKPIHADEECSASEECLVYDMGIIRIVPSKERNANLYWPTDIITNDDINLPSLRMRTIEGHEISLHQVCNTLRCEGLSFVATGRVANSDEFQLIGELYTKTVNGDISYVQLKVSEQNFELDSVTDLASAIDFRGIKRSRGSFGGTSSWISFEGGRVREWNGEADSLVNSDDMLPIEEGDALRGQETLESFLGCLAEDDQESEDPSSTEGITKLKECSSVGFRELQHLSKVMLGTSFDIDFRFGGLELSAGRDSLGDTPLVPSLSTSRWRMVEVDDPCVDDDDCVRPAGDSLLCNNDRCESPPCSL